METRKCVICGADVTREKFRNPPERTTCSSACSGSLQNRHSPRTMTDMDMVIMHECGATFAEIGKAAGGLTRERVRQIIGKYVSRQKNYNAKSVTLAAQAKAMIERGHSLAHAAKTIGISTLTLRKYLNVGDLRAKSSEARFWSRVNKNGAFHPVLKSNCWEWTGSKTLGGYGNLSFCGKHAYSHRVSWLLAGGEIPDGMCVLHKCDNPKCVNPSHLFVGDSADNAQDRDRKGRNIRPAHNGIGSPSKLTPDQVKKILYLYGRGVGTCGDLAHSYGVSSSSVDNIIKGRLWKHITANAQQ